MDHPAKTATRERRTRAEIRQIVADFASSGMEAIEFCQCRGISRSTLYRHLSKRTQSQAKAGNRFLAVELRAASGSTSGNGGGLLVALSNGRKIEVSRGFDAATLERLLTVLDKV